MATDSFKIKKSLNLEPIAGASPSAEGDIVYDDTANEIKYNNGSSRTVVNTDGTQTLTNKTLTAPAISTISNTGTLTLPTSTDTLVGRATTDTLTNKTLTTPTTDIVNIDGQASAPANPSSGYYKMYVDDTSGKLTILNSSGVATQVGGGSGLKNYITYPDAESGTTGWSTYADAAGTRPVDGTGGSPNVTWTASTTTPLSSNTDFNFVKDAANRQGEGVGYAFSIDRSDQGKPLQIEFDYELISGTWAGSVAPATDSDMIVYIYDVTNAVLIEPQGRLLEPMVTSMYYRYRGTFQTAINSTSYRLILHCATTSASAYTLAFDDFRVGPQVVSNGAVVTDINNSWTPTFTGAGSVTAIDMKWGRIGDKLHFIGTFTEGTSTAAITFTLPNGYTIDSTKISSSNYQTIGMGSIDTGYAVSLLAQGNLGTITMGIAAAPNAINTPFAAWGNNSRFQVNGIVPISGWSSNVQMSSDSDTRVVVASYYVSTNFAATTSTPVNFDTKIFDTHGAVTTSASAWKFTAPVSGYYLITGYWYSASIVYWRVYKNGSYYKNIGGNPSYVASQFLGHIDLNAGDYIDIRPAANATAGGGSLASDTTTSMTIQRVSGPSQIAASETVAASYWLSANQAVTADTTALNCDTKIIDTHNMNSSGTFTIPTSGVYHIALTGATSAATSACYVSQTGSQTLKLFLTGVNSSAINGGTATLTCAAGDVIKILPENNFTWLGGAAAGGYKYTHVSIHRI